MFLRIKCALRNKCIWQSNAECNIMSASFSPREAAASNSSSLCSLSQEYPISSMLWF